MTHSPLRLVLICLLVLAPAMVGADEVSAKLVKFEEPVDKAVDAIRDRFGDGSVSRGRTLKSPSDSSPGGR